MPRFEDFLTLNSFIYDNPPPAKITVDGPGGAQEWVRLLESNAPTDAGYYAAAYLNAQTNEVILVNRGTNDLADLVTDMQMALDVVPGQLDRAELFYNRVRAEAVAKETTLSITGHSLGGSLTQLLIATHANDVINGSGVFGQTFNALGVKGLLDNLGLSVDASYAVTNWVVPTDVVGNLAEHVGDTATLSSLPFAFTYLAGPPGALAFLYDSHQIDDVLDNFNTENQHPLLQETEDFLIQTYVTDPGFDVQIDGAAYVGGNNRINVGNELNGGALNDLMFGGLPDDRIHGGAGDDVIYAGAGNDTLFGDAGADILLGEDGNDTYIVDDPNDRVIEAALGGTDTVASTVSYTLSCNVEQLILQGTDEINGTGNEQDNVLIGNSEANVLDGGEGADAMAGGAGDDTYLVENVRDTVVEASGEGADTVQSAVDYTLAANVENLTLTGTAVSGTGNALDNVLTGNSATNILVGGGGNDVLQGGAGHDLFLYNSGDGQDLILDSSSSQGDGQGAVVFDNHLVQGGIKRTGESNYTSSDGQFTYQLSGTDLLINGTLTVKDFTNGQLGITLVDPVATATRTTYLQEVTNPTPPPPTHLVPIFDDLNNVYLDADGEHDLIHALGGDDVVYGGPGEDQLYGDAGNDQLIGNGAVGAVDAENDYLDGGDGNDLLQGGGGADVVLGGAGNDNLNGDVPTAENLGHNDDWLEGGETSTTSYFIERMAAR